MQGFSKLLIQDYQKKANLTMALICRILTALMAVTMVLNLLGVFKIENDIYPTIIVSIVILLVPTLLYNVLHLNYLYVRYLVLTLIVLMSGILYSILSYHVIIMLVFPVVISCLYCDTKSVAYASVLSIPVMIVSHLIAFQLKIVPDEPLVTLKGVWLYGILPRVIEFAAVAIICITTARKIQKLINRLAEKNDELYQEQETLVTSLAEMIEAQSQETGKHVKRVSEYTRILCEALGMNDEEVWEVSSAAALHDVGKIMVPQDIINKPGKLTDEEFAVIKTHVQYGKKLLEKCQGELMQISADIAYHHHERYDGTGYMGVKGEYINLYARCVSVADVFDALVSRRPYKKAWAPEDARAEILSQRGRQFDPHIVDLFEANYDKFLSILEKYPDDCY